MQELWKALPQTIIETDLLSKMTLDIQAIQFNEASKKLQRIQALNDTIKNNEEELQFQYVILMRERNLYLQKLKNIQAVCNSLKWEGDPNVIEIKKLFDKMGDTNYLQQRNTEN